MDFLKYRFLFFDDLNYVFVVHHVHQANSLWWKFRASALKSKLINYGYRLASLSGIAGNYVTVSNGIGNCHNKQYKSVLFVERRYLMSGNGKFRWQNCKDESGNGFTQTSAYLKLDSMALVIITTNHIHQCYL